MKQTRKEKCNTQKVTRWDRIRKRNTNKSLIPLKSDAVKYFFQKDYISQYEQAILCGEAAKLYQELDPVLVMDMRHGMFQKIPRKLPLVTVGGQRTLDACISHNMIVEERYINNELNKFREQLQKNHKRNTILKFKFNEKSADEEEDAFKVDNCAIITSLERTAKHIEKLYAAPLDALETIEELCKYTPPKEAGQEGEGKEVKEKELNGVEDRRNKEDGNENGCAGKVDSSEVIKERTESDIDAKHANEKTLQQQFEELQLTEFSLENLTSNMPSTYVSGSIQNQTESTLTVETVMNMQQPSQTRVVRFIDETPALEEINFNCKDSLCSSNKDEFDSVAADLAAEALHELQMEAERELAKSFKATAPLTETAIFENNEHKNVKTSTGQLNLKNNGRTTKLKNGQQLLQALNITKLTKPAQGDTERTNSEDTEQEVNSNYGEENSIIEQLFATRVVANNRKPILLSRYFKKWLHFVTIEKIEREEMYSKGDRIHKINLFLDKIRKEKLRLTRQARECTAVHVRGSGDSGGVEAAAAAAKRTVEALQVTKKYENKIKIQQDIIELQRLKLERQERAIMELKLMKLSDEAKEARQDLKNELKTMIKHGDTKFKAKAKCLQLIGNLKEQEGSVSCQGTSTPKFLREMQERALERSIRHEKARQRRLQHEAELEAQKLAAEEAKRLEDEEAKRQRIEALKEKRRQEKLAKILKERERQRALEARAKADAYYRRWLLRNVVMRGFKSLIARKRENKRKCEEFRLKIFKRTYFTTWRDYYLKMRTQRLTLAEDLYERILKRQAIEQWLAYVQDERSKWNVAVDWCDLKRCERVFSGWAKHTKRMKAIEAAKMNQARAHHEWHLKWKVLNCWQHLPQILLLERQTEERRQRWRMKIWELLPDYKPNREEDY